jgi:CRP-like cAMP-binding protein
MRRSDASSSAPPRNYLLSALPPREYHRVLAHLEPAPLDFKAVLHEAGQPIEYVYFPLSGMLSLLNARDGRTASLEIGVVGREGMAGLPVFLGPARPSTRTVVQVPGEALRMRADKLRRVVSRHSKLHELLLRYVHVFVTQLSHWSICNSLHPVEKRLCRWLLTVQNCAARDSFSLTHERLAALLGVRRASVTEAARRLRRGGLIDYAGGQLTVLDRRGLDALSCGCHRAVEAELAQMLR